MLTESDALRETGPTQAGNALLNEVRFGPDGKKLRIRPRPRSSYFEVLLETTDSTSSTCR